MGLKYYADMEDAPLYDLIRQANNNTKNQLMDLSDYSWQDCPDTGKIAEWYIIFYQGEPIDYGTHFLGLVVQSSTESEYNAACTEKIDL